MESILKYWQNFELWTFQNRQLNSDFWTNSKTLKFGFLKFQNRERILKPKSAHGAHLSQVINYLKR